jgi:subtilisin-like proprotein convertase family protein
VKFFDSRSFVMAATLLSLTAAGVQAQTTKTTFTNSAVITVPASGTATPYPSTLAVAGVTGFTYHMSVSLTMTHGFPQDLDILLVSPGGRAVLLMSDVATAANFSSTRIDFDDCAPRSLYASNPVTTSRFRPSNFGIGAGDTMPAPAPAGPYLNTLADFNAVSPNGTWSLYVNDDFDPDGGTISSWSLTFFTQPATALIGGRNPISCTAPDYDGDGRTDVAIFRPATGEWFIAQSGSNNLVTIVGWGAPSSTGANDTEAPADYDGDGVTDVAVYRQSTGVWYIRNSFSPTIQETAFGAPGFGDTPVPGDYDGDGQADIAIYRSTTGEWFLRPSSGKPVTSFPFGYPPTGDRPARR